ncbi:hypothetical protein Tco_0304370 [Tanacetum coccineum]
MSDIYRLRTLSFSPDHGWQIPLTSSGQYRDCLELGTLNLDIRAIVFVRVVSSRIWELCRRRISPFYPFMKRFGLHSFPIMYSFPLRMGHMIHDLELSHLCKDVVKVCSTKVYVFVPVVDPYSPVLGLSLSLVRLCSFRRPVLVRTSVLWPAEVLLACIGRIPPYTLSIIKPVSIS